MAAVNVYLNYQARAVSAPWNRGIEFLVFATDRLHESYIAQPLVFEKYELGTKSEDPTFLLPIEMAQTLIDDLWHCGLRPSEGTGSAGALAATQKHLDDMRTIAFDLLKRGA